MGALKKALGDSGRGLKGGPRRFGKGPEENRGWPGNGPHKKPRRAGEEVPKQALEVH
jgi:hypothetical protein